MKLARLETKFCGAGWRPWIFVKATCDDGLVGWAEITDAHGSPRGLAGVVDDLAPLLVGRDPRPVERIHWDLYRHTRQSPGGVIARAIAGIENALLDVKAKALGVSVYEFFGGPTRDSIPVYWSHCGTTRAWGWRYPGVSKLGSYEDVAALGREVVDRGFPAFKTNIVIPGEDPRVLMPGFGDPGSAPGQLPTQELLETLESLLTAFRDGTGGRATPIVDLNFNLKPDGALSIARALEPFGLLWLEIDCFDPAALADLRRRTPMPLCSGENLYGGRGYRDYFERHAVDVASVDVTWNGFAQSKKIADMAECYELNCTPHNFYSHLATFISAQWCAAISNVEILEVDIDDVPWKDDVTTAVPEIRDGRLAIPTGVGWGVDIVEEVLMEHPWPVDEG